MEACWGKNDGLIFTIFFETDPDFETRQTADREEKCQQSNIKEYPLQRKSYHDLNLAIRF